MTKTEARIQLKKGKKLTHRYFLPDEYIYEIEGQLIDEKGIKLPTELFWEYRKQLSFEEGWEIYEEAQNG